MGLDMSYQALTADCDLINRARADAEVGEAIGMLRFWFRERGTPSRATWLAPEGLREEIEDLARKNRGLESRNCDLGRLWDVMHYLLSAIRRGDLGAPTDELFDKAVRGGYEIGGHARASQGIPIRYCNPVEVAAIARLISPLSFRSLRAHYSPVAMEAAAVYKFVAGRDDHFWEVLPPRFAAFRQLYLEAARHGEGILICLD